ncbi:MAG TPA: carboxypeptidase M32 [Polyangiaceae bacterium]|jgi:carboxypeptidase Taq
MNNDLATLKELLLEHGDLTAAAALLSWDQATYMPKGGGPARGRQLAVLERLAHERLSSPEIRGLLDSLTSLAEAHDSDDACLIDVTRRDHQRASRVPSEFVAELAQHKADTYETWVRARAASDFSLARGALEKTVDYSRRYAAFFELHEHPIDALIDEVDPGMTAATVRQLFSELRAALVPLAQAMTSQPPADDACLRFTFPEDAQLAFGRRVIEKFGYDFDRGRQDKTHHPFMTKFSLDDVRITTRVNRNDLSEALFSTLHEAGHAMYEQNIDPTFDGTPLGHGASAGVHESQSRLWENLVGRSRGFWKAFYPDLQQAFPGQLGAVSLDTFYRAINKVERSRVRTNADEVTYGLHVIMRFDFELELLEGKLAVADLPSAWRRRSLSDLGVEPEGDRDGALQDVHWYGGLVGGAFQCYVLGNLMSAQFYEAALSAVPGIAGDIEQGRFDRLRGWLVENVYRHGRKFLPADLVKRATGKPLSVEPYVQYLRRKYGELYELPA